MHKDEQRDLLDDEFEIVDLEDGERHVWPGLNFLQGQRFSRRVSGYLVALILVTAVIGLVVLGPNLAFVSQRLVGGAQKIQANRGAVVIGTPVAQEQQLPIVTMETLGDVIVVWTSPAMQDAAGRIVALSRGTGQVRWESQPTIMAMGVADGKLWVQEADNSLNGISAHDGSLVWKRDLPPASHVVDVHDGLIYVQNIQLALFVYHIADGSLQWQYAHADRIVQFGPGMIYVTKAYSSVLSVLMGLRERDGKVVWQYTLPMVPQSLKVDQDIAYVSGMNDLLIAVRVGASQSLWEQQLKLGDVVSQAVDGRVYVELAGHKRLDVLDGHTGSLAWSFQQSDLSLVAVQQQLVYIKVFQGVTVLSSQHGTTIWSYGTSITAPNIQMDGGVLYANSLVDGVVNAMDATTGKLLWHYDAFSTTNKPAKQQAAVGKIESGVLYLVLRSDLSLRALDTHTMVILWQTALN
ncbi:hypothetical protein KDW_28420 [Dictyobacter vulcani]|uniref:Pyrrolo-quinoline quinone repeat domain-containing protein n=1 Tax=Dictyobacter vulcani TaxID=2607529 RepID=A0A5J4KQG9_9CHLR|nr:PQQ-binding-like beta-propeller repeat protein [Dictyobacter vulcani]GER88680.1 hypothetical protein KDW_28420 [Dictyobacter vulcani]